MSKIRECSLRDNTTFICDDVTNGTVLVTDKLEIPETNHNMDLVGKALCRYHYNKLIVNENHRLKTVMKNQQCAHPKHEEYIKNNKKGRPRKHILVKIPQRLQPILNLPSDTLICNPCLIAMDRDKENQQSSNYQPPIQRVPVANDHSYVLRNDPLYSAKEYNKLENLYHEVCEDFNQIKLSE
jgi:hypothetical protein